MEAIGNQLEPLRAMLFQIGAFVPRLVLGLVILLAGWLVAKGVRLAGVVDAGQGFGDAVMFLERPALVDAEAATDALLLLLPKEAVFTEIERNPRFVDGSARGELFATVEPEDVEATGPLRARAGSGSLPKSGRA